MKTDSVAQSRAPRVNREQSAMSAEDPTKKSIVYESLWSVDYSYESPSKK